MARGRQEKQTQKQTKKQTKKQTQKQTKKQPPKITAKQAVILVDIWPEKIDKLPETIKFAMETRSAIVPFSSMGDHLPGVELCQIPEVKELFVKACVEYGLIGWLLYQESYFPKSNDSISTIIMIAYGTLTDSDGKECTIKIDELAVKEMFMASVSKARELYGV